MTQFFSLLAFVYAADIGAKAWVRAKMPLGSSIDLLPFFSLCHIENTGIAFGMFQGWNPVLIVLGGAVVAVVVWMGVRLYKEDRFTSLVLAAVMGGALGNLTDRVLRGRVTDFLDFYAGSHHWPAFNVADSVICVGAALLIIQNIRAKPPNPRSESQTDFNSK